MKTIASSVNTFYKKHGLYVFYLPLFFRFLFKKKKNIQQASLTTNLSFIRKLRSKANLLRYLILFLKKLESSWWVASVRTRQDDFRG